MSKDDDDVFSDGHDSDSGDFYAYRPMTHLVAIVKIDQLLRESVAQAPTFPSISLDHVLQIARLADFLMEASLAQSASSTYKFFATSPAVDVRDLIARLHDMTVMFREILLNSETSYEPSSFRSDNDE